MFGFRTDRRPGSDLVFCKKLKIIILKIDQVFTVAP
jgi:hypothetical protein